MLPAVEHEARPPAVGDEPPRLVDLAEEGGCYYALLLVRVEAAVLGGELLCHHFGDDARGGAAPPSAAPVLFPSFRRLHLKRAERS